MDSAQYVIPRIFLECSKSPSLYFYPPPQDGEIGVVRADGTSLDLSRTEIAPELEIQVK
jgi:hypothetical protein